jgi:DNA-directed RNA polymerase subunit RPC12/RpoP
VIRTRKLQIACPQCGSADVFYSCTPNCCFNHVCGDCGTTFEPVTVAQGGAVTGIVPPDPAPDATDPTAECVRCTSPTVYMMEEGGLVCDKLVCGKCGAILALEITEIAPG